MQRIRRAQELGKSNVKLSQPEIDALQRKRQKDTEREVRPKAKDRHRSSGLTKKPGKKDHTRERRSDIHPSNYDGESARRPPGFLVPSPTGGPSYAPLGYYAPSNPALQGKSSRSGSRSALSKDLARLSPDVSRSRQPRSPPSNASTRSLPDDPNWMPRPRSSSSSISTAPHSPDPNSPYLYQAYSPPLPQIPIQYASQARRIVSNPQPQTRDRLPRYEGLGIRAPRREHSAPESHRESTSEASLDSDDDSDEGVQVNVLPASNGRGYEIRSASDNTFEDRDRRRR